MKNVKINILFMVLLLSPLCAAWGQSTVSEVQYTKSDTSIVRYWQGSISIVYTRNIDKNNWFLLVDTTDPQVRRIVVPNDVTVNDFRIMRDTVFVCGHHVDGSGTQRGLLAYFAIQDFYNGSGAYNWGVTIQTPMPDCYSGGCYNQISDITRLAVYDSNGHTKIAFIAKNYIVAETTYRVGVGSAVYRPSWEVVFIYNKYGIEEYTDIITTQNYVVAVARTNDSSRLALRIYPKNDFILKTAFPSYPPSYYYHNKFGQGLPDLEVDENVIATALDGDEFAVAYHYTNSPKDGLAVKTFGISGGLATLLQGLNAPVVRQPGSIWKMRDVCYSPSLQQMLVLNDFDGGTVGSQTSIVYKFPLSALATGVTFYNGRYLVGYNLYALDPFGSTANSFVSSGSIVGGGGMLSLFWEGINYGVSCGLQDIIMGSHVSPSLYTTFMQTNINEPTTPKGTAPFVVESVEMNKICDK